MAHLVDKDALVVEIEKRRKEWQYGSSTEAKFKREECDDILSFINALKVKEVDLEEKATQLSQKYFPDEENIWARANIEAYKCKSACIEMAEWFKAQKRE